MPETRSYVIHTNGLALWPEHKPLSEVLDLRDTTPEGIWEATYQGNPVPPGGVVFRREWWEDNSTRVNLDDENLPHRTIARYISWDTALKDKNDSDWSVGVVGELQHDYRLLIRRVYRQRLTFPYLPPHIGQVASAYAWDGKTRAVIVEDKASGTSAYQTLLMGADRELARTLVPFMPQGDKQQRAQQAAVWCKNGCVLLPWPGEETAEWLLGYETELFGFPLSAYDDQVDATSQLILYTENLLAEGWRKRGGRN